MINYKIGRKEVDMAAFLSAFKISRNPRVRARRWIYTELIGNNTYKAELYYYRNKIRVLVINRRLNTQIKTLVYSLDVKSYGEIKRFTLRYINARQNKLAAIKAAKNAPKDTYITLSNNRQITRANNTINANMISISNNKFLTEKMINTLRKEIVEICEKIWKKFGVELI